MPEWKRIDAEMTDMRCAVYGLQTRLKIGAEDFDCQFFGDCCKSLEKRVCREEVVQRLDVRRLSVWVGHDQRQMRESPLRRHGTAIERSRDVRIHTGRVSVILLRAFECAHGWYRRRVEVPA